MAKKMAKLMSDARAKKLGIEGTKADPDYKQDVAEKKPRKKK